MAYVSTLERANKPVSTRHRTETRCEIATGWDGDTKLVQINTYGSENRERTEHASQTIQLSRQAAEQLVRILREEFDLD